MRIKTNRDYLTLDNGLLKIGDDVWYWNDGAHCENIIGTHSVGSDKGFYYQTISTRIFSNLCFGDPESLRSYYHEKVNKSIDELIEMEKQND